MVALPIIGFPRFGISLGSSFLIQSLALTHLPFDEGCNPRQPLLGAKLRWHIFLCQLSDFGLNQKPVLINRSLFRAVREEVIEVRSAASDLISSNLALEYW